MERKYNIIDKSLYFIYFLFLVLVVFHYMTMNPYVFLFLPLPVIGFRLYLHYTQKANMLLQIFLMVAIHIYIFYSIY